MTRANRARLLLFAGVVALAVCLSYASGWRIDNRLEGWSRTPSDGYKLLLEHFGGDEFVLVRVDGIRLDDETQLSWLGTFGGALKELPAVSEVLDPLHLPGSTSSNEREGFEQALQRPLVQELDLLHLDSQRADFLLEIETSSTPEERAEFSAKLNGLSQRAASHGLRVRSAGHPIVGTALDVEAARIEEVFAPLLALAGLIATAIALRSLWLSILTLLPAALASAGVRSALRALEIPSNMILAAVGPLVFVLTVASVLHVVAAYRQLIMQGSKPEEAAREARRRIFFVAMLAAFTTAAGFGVFAFAPVQAVRHLGVATALSILIVAPVSHWILPVLLSGLAPRFRTGQASGKSWLHPRFWRVFAIGASRRRVQVLATAALALVAGVYGVFAVNFGTNAVDYFPVGHPIREAFLSIEAEGGSLSSLDLLVERAEPTDWDESERIRASLMKLENVIGVFGPGTVRADLEVVAGPMAPLLLEQSLVRAKRTDADGDWLRFTIRMQTGGAEFTRRVSKAIETAAKKESDGTIYVTGSLDQLLGLQGELTETLATSLSWTGAIIAGVFLVVVRNFRDWCVALFVNFVPVACVLAAAWILGLSLDASTVMVASVVMGIAVDNTFHLLRAGRGHGGGFLISRVRSFQKVGEAAVTSSLALASGFGLLAFSPFAPTSRFGLLCAVGVVAAFLADFALLPALWLRSTRGSTSRRSLKYRSP